MNFLYIILKNKTGENSHEEQDYEFLSVNNFREWDEEPKTCDNMIPIS